MPPCRHLQIKTHTEKGKDMSAHASVNRRLLLTGAAALLAGSTIAATSTTFARATDTDLPAGWRRGRIVAREDGAPIYEILDAAGHEAGYALSQEDMEEARRAAKDVETERRDLQAVGADFWKITKCTAAIAWFTAQTVFPSVKVARIAYNLSRLVKKYGARKVASSFLRWRSSKGRDMEDDIKDVALALTGVGALSVCFD